MNDKFIVEWIEQKGPDWKVCDLKAQNGVTVPDVSINRVNKKGETFPNFDAITLQATIEGNLWKSSTGKAYLFAPQVKKGNFGGAMPAQLMKKKEEGIRAAQENKSESIKVSSTMRDAVAITLAQMSADIILSKDPGAIKSMVKEWRLWLWKNWDIDVTDVSEPFPSEPTIQLEDESLEEMFNQM